MTFSLGVSTNNSNTMTPTICGISRTMNFPTPWESKAVLARSWNALQAVMFEWWLTRRRSRRRWRWRRRTWTDVHVTGRILSPRCALDSTSASQELWCSMLAKQLFSPAQKQSASEPRTALYNAQVTIFIWAGLILLVFCSQGIHEVALHAAGGYLGSLVLLLMRSWNCCHQLHQHELSGPVWVDNWEDRDDITATWWQSSCGLNLSKGGRLSFLVADLFNWVFWYQISSHLTSTISGE